MTEDHDERTETLLGRYLLGHATEIEIHELQRRKQASPALRSAIELLDASHREFDQSPFKEDSMMDGPSLPEYYEPQRLAHSMRRWTTLGTAASCLAVAVLFALATSGILELDRGFEAWQVIPLAMAGSLGIGLVLFVAARRHRGYPYARAPWSQLIEQLDRERDRYTGHRAAIAMVAAGVSSPILFVMSGLVPGPLDTPLAYASYACLAFGVHVAVRRWKLRTLASA